MHNWTKGENMDAAKTQNQAAQERQGTRPVRTRTASETFKSGLNQPDSARIELEQKESTWMWVLIFSALELLFPFVMSWMMNIQSGISISWITSAGFWIEMLQWGFILGMAFLTVRFIQKKSHAKDSFWWLVGLGCGAAVLLLGFHQWPQDSLQIIQYLVSSAVPAVLIWLNAVVFLCHGNLWQSALFLICSLCSAKIVSGLQSPFFMLVQALLPLVFLMVLSVDFAQEEPNTQSWKTGENELEANTESAEDAEGKKAWFTKKALRKYAGRISAICLTGCFGFILLFGWGLLPWIPTAVATGSMVPAIEIGDLAVVDTRLLEPRSGDIIQFSKQGVSVVHRVIEIQQQDDSIVYITKGDHNESADEEVVYPEEIEGIVCKVIPKLGWLTLWTHTTPSS